MKAKILFYKINMKGKNSKKKKKKSHIQFYINIDECEIGCRNLPLIVMEQVTFIRLKMEKLQHRHPALTANRVLLQL